MIAKADIDRLTPQEKLLLVAETWDSLGAEAGNIPVSDEERNLLDRRWTAYLANPASALTQEEFDRSVDEGR